MGPAAQPPARHWSAGGKRGNPVILPRALLARIDELDRRHALGADGLDALLGGHGPAAPSLGPHWYAAA